MSVWAKESKATAHVTVEGFEVTSPGADRDELNEAAYEIASAIGSALSSLGTSSIHGRVTVTLDGVTGTDSDDE